MAGTASTLRPARANSIAICHRGADSCKCGASHSSASNDDLVRRDRELAHAFACGMKHRVRRRGCDSDNPDLAEPFSAEWIHIWIVFVDENDVDPGDVAVHRHMITSEIAVHKVPVAPVHDR